MDGTCELKRRKRSTKGRIGNEEEMEGDARGEGWVTMTDGNNDEGNGESERRRKEIDKIE